MKISTLSLIRARQRRWFAWLRGDLWFPHVPLALLLALGGGLLLRLNFAHDWRRYLDAVLRGNFNLSPALLPPLVIGGGMLIMAAGLLSRSRLAWTMALLLALTAAASLWLGKHASGHVLLVYFVAVVLVLFASWRQFDRSSVAASTLFAVTSVVMLLLYSTFGAYYLGHDFKPKITDLVTAFYFAMVTMSTVGYGDIIPQSINAKLFSVSVIVLGVAVFATSLTAVIGPMVSNSLQRIVNRKDKRMKRENHYVVIGASPLAFYTARELTKRGQPVTRILREKHEDIDGDLITGDPSSVEILREAGADKAEAVLAMMLDDSENAFVVLAVKEMGGKTRTVTAINDAAHIGRIKLVKPDVMIAPQGMGAELSVMLLLGEQVPPDFVMRHVFMGNNANPDEAAAPTT